MLARERLQVLAVPGANSRILTILFKMDDITASLWGKFPAIPNSACCGAANCGGRVWRTGLPGGAEPDLPGPFLAKRTH